MVKWVGLSMTFLAIVATAGPAYAEEAFVCENHSVTFKRREYQCLLTASSSARPVKFKADFRGSHDDTQLSISLRLDGLPVNCGKGSKTWLNGEDGEDGDVSLECHFVLDGAAGTKRMLYATVNIYHAEFVGHRLSAF